LRNTLQLKMRPAGLIGGKRRATHFINASQ
jgi:hypothetical protein